MIQKFYFWVCLQKNQKQGLEEIFAYHVYGSIICSSQKVEATQMSIDRWIINKTMEYYLALKRKRSSDTYYSVNELWGHYANWNKLVTKIQILYVSLIWDI